MKPPPSIYRQVEKKKMLILLFLFARFVPDSFSWVGRCAPMGLSTADGKMSFDQLLLPRVLRPALPLPAKWVPAGITCHAAVTGKAGLSHGCLLGLLGLLAWHNTPLPPSSPWPPFTHRTRWSCHSSGVQIGGSSRGRDHAGVTSGNAWSPWTSDGCPFCACDWPRPLADPGRCRCGPAYRHSRRSSCRP